MGSSLRIRVLGPLRVEVDGSVVPVSSPSQRRLLMRLVAANGHAVGVDALADAIWGEDLPKDPANAVRYHVWKLRSEVVGEQAIETIPGGYRLAAHAVDADEFLDAVGPANRAADPASGLATAEAALTLFAGRPYADAGDSEFAVVEIRRLDEAHRVLRVSRARWQIELGRTGEAIPDLEALVAEHPYDEGAWSVLMTALYREGRQTDALRAYERARVALGEDVGLEPSPELRQLEQLVLDHDDRLSVRGEAPSNLPSIRTSFVGRDADMERIAATLRDRRFVTIVGPGGSGKTRLAIETARAMVPEYPDGVWIIDLASHRGSDDLFEVVGETIGLALASPEARPEADVVAFLRRRCALLVLDNCEHLLDGAASLASRISATGREVGILATSRSALLAPGEVTYSIPMLDAEPMTGSPALVDIPAVRLFLDRASDAGARLDGTPDTLDAVVQLCRLVEGLPLAIEMVAARNATVQPRELVSQVEGGLASYGRRRGADDRHATMESTIRWSFDLLPPDEQELFVRLSVFAGGFTREAAVHVCGSESLPSGAVGSVLDGLVEQSLVHVDLDGRYRLLEPVRVFGREQLHETDSVEATRRVHAETFAAMAIDAATVRRGRRRMEVDARLARESANLRSALEWAEEAGEWRLLGELTAALTAFWLYHESDDMRRWSGACAPHLDRLPDDVAAPIEAVLATDRTRTAEQREASGTHALALAEASGDPVLYADVVRYLFEGEDGTLELALEPHEFMAMFRRAADQYEHRGDSWELVDILNLWASERIVDAAPDFRDIFAMLDRARAIARSSGYASGSVWANLNALRAHMAQHPDGTYDQAVVMALFEDSLTSIATLDAPELELDLRNAWAWHLARVGEMEAAAQEFRLLAASAEASGSLFYAIVVHTGLAWATEESDIAEGKSALRSALEFAVERSIWRQTVWVVETGARLLALDGDPELAARLLGTCEHVRRTGDNLLPAWDVSTYAETRTRVASATGDRFGALLSEGASWTLDQAIDRLLGALPQA